MNNYFLKIGLAFAFYLSDNRSTDKRDHQPTMGRKAHVTDTDLLCVSGKTASTRLKLSSDRRAVIDKIVELGGRALLEEVNTAFGFDTRDIINALMADGWLEVDNSQPLPTRWPKEQRV